MFIWIPPDTGKDRSEMSDFDRKIDYESGQQAKLYMMKWCVIILVAFIGICLLVEWLVC